MRIEDDLPIWKCISYFFSYGHTATAGQPKNLGRHTHIVAVWSYILIDTVQQSYGQPEKNASASQNQTSAQCACHNFPASAFMAQYGKENTWVHCNQAHHSSVPGYFLFTLLQSYGRPAWGRGDKDTLGSPAGTECICTQYSQFTQLRGRQKIYTTGLS